MSQATWGIEGRVEINYIEAKFSSRYKSIPRALKLPCQRGLTTRWQRLAPKERSLQLHSLHVGCRQGWRYLRRRSCYQKQTSAPSPLCSPPSLSDQSGDIDGPSIKGSQAQTRCQYARANVFITYATGRISSRLPIVHIRVMLQLAHNPKCTEFMDDLRV